MVSEPAVTVIDTLAMTVIVVGTLQACAGMVAMLARRPTDSGTRRHVWLTYGRWLVAALTFQLAGDIIESSIVPTWEAIGQLGVVAIIRTFLNYFLERDIAEIRDRQHAVAAGDSSSRL